MADKIGEYIQKRLRAKNIEDKEAAGFLNIAPSTLRKKFPLDDLYISNIIDFSKLLDEDIILDFYYCKEPLKSLRDKQVKLWEDQIKALKEENTKQAVAIDQLNDHIKTQKELIASLRRELELQNRK